MRILNDRIFMQGVFGGVPHGVEEIPCTMCMIIFGKVYSRRVDVFRNFWVLVWHRGVGLK